MNASAPRKPVAFRIDDPQVTIAREPDFATGVPALAALPPRRRRKWLWSSLFWSAFGGLVSLALTLAVIRLIEDLFARAPWLGWVGLALASVAAAALVAVVAREVIGLSRLAAVETLRERAAAAIVSDDRDGARALVRDLLVFARAAPRFARGRAELESHVRSIIDGTDLIRLAERDLMAPLDAEARRLVSTAAKRVSVVTAVSPRAAVDMAFVLFTAVRMIRALAELSGGRPGTLGLFRLVRLTITHLALTGGMAAGDSIIQQMLGHGVAAKLSARLGEGVLNGLLTARLGLAAIEVARPLPFSALPPPSMSDLAGGLLRRRGEEVGDPG